MADTKGTRFEGEGIVTEVNASSHYLQINGDAGTKLRGIHDYCWSEKAPVAKFASRLEAGDQIRFKGDAQDGLMMLDFVEIRGARPMKKEEGAAFIPYYQATSGEKPAGNDNLQAIVERKKAQYKVFWNEAKTFVFNEFPSASSDAKLAAIKEIASTWYISYCQENALKDV